MVGTVGRCPIPSTIDALRLDLRPGGPFAFEPPTRGGPPGVLRDDGRTRGSGTWFSAEVGFVPRLTSGDRPSGGTNAFTSPGRAHGYAVRHRPVPLPRANAERIHGWFMACQLNPNAASLSGA